MKVLVIVLVLAAGGPPGFQGHPMGHERVALDSQVRFTGPSGWAMFRVRPGRWPVTAFIVSNERFAPCSQPRTITVRRHPQRVTVYCGIK